MEPNERETLGRIKQQLENSEKISQDIEDAQKEIFKNVETSSKHTQKIEGVLNTHIEVSKREFKNHKDDIVEIKKDVKQLKLDLANEIKARESFEKSVGSSILTVKVIVGFIGIITGIPLAIITFIKLVKMMGG